MLSIADIPFGTHRIINPEPALLQAYISDVGHQRTKYPDYRHMGQNTLSYRLSLQYTITGTGKLTHRTGEHLLPPGTLMVVNTPSNYIYETPPGQIWEFIYLSLTGQLAELLGRKIEAILGPRLILNSKDKVLGDFFLIVENCLNGRLPDAYSNSLQAYSLLMNLLCEGNKHNSISLSRESVLAQTMEYVRNHIKENLTVNKLAEYANMSSYHFCRKFKEHTGYPPGEFILRERLYHATHLLQTTLLPAREISLRCGFNDYVHFGKIFRRKIGLTPIEYRKHNYCLFRNNDMETPMIGHD